MCCTQINLSLGVAIKSTKILVLHLKSSKSPLLKPISKTVGGLDSKRNHDILKSFYLNVCLAQKAIKIWVYST